MTFNQIFKRVMVLGGLLCLTACGHDENPILHSELAKKMTQAFVNRQTVAMNKKPCTDLFCKAHEKNALMQQLAIKIKNNLQCPYYFAEPEQQVNLKTTCEVWMNQVVIPEYQDWWPNYAKDKDLKPATVTNEELRDPTLWKLITAAMNHVKKEHKATS